MDNVCKCTVRSVPSLLPVALGLRAAEDSAGFLGTFGTLKAAWAEEERFPSTLSSSSKLRSGGRGHKVLGVLMSTQNIIIKNGGTLFLPYSRHVVSTIRNYEKLPLETMRNYKKKKTLLNFSWNISKHLGFHLPLLCWALSKVERRM